MRTVLVCLAAVALAACGGDSDTTVCGTGTTLVDGTCVADGDDLTCGAGTYEFMGECVAVDPNDSTAPVTTATPAGGRARALPAVVTLQTDEPATIYYTTDGSEPTTSSSSASNTAVITGVADGTEVRFFAVDLNDNSETAQTETYELDIDGPAPVTALAAALATMDVTLTWTNPTDADFAGVVVARGPVARDPVDGQTYTTSDTLPGGEAILYVGNAATVGDTLAGPGNADYAAWAFDDLGNYSPLRVSNTVSVPLPAQTGALSVAMDGTVTVTTAPANLPLSATATYVGTTLTVSLQVTNSANRVLHNLKALATPAAGTISERQFQGTPFAYYGPEALAAGANRSRDLIIDGVDTGDFPVAVTLEFLDHPTLLASDDVIDSSGAIDSNTDTPLRDRRQIVVEGTGRFAFSFDKQDPLLQVLDLTTLERIADVQLGVWGSIGGLAVLGDRVYAAYSNGAHYNCTRGNESGDPSRGGVEIVSIDIKTMTEVERFTLVAPTLEDGVCARGMALSPDKKLAAVTVGRAGAETNELWLVDLGAMAVAPGAQPIQLTADTGLVVQPAWNDTGDTLYVGFSNYNENGAGDTSTAPPIDVVNIATRAVTQLSFTTTGLFTRGIVARAGKIYASHGDSRDAAVVGLAVIDTTNSNAETFPDPGWAAGHGGGGVVFHPGGQRYFASRHQRGNCETAMFDTSNDTRVDDDGDGTFNLDICSRGHGDFALTPF